MTGLAGGDHLHFSIQVQGHPVNPVEWWDPHWIEDRVLRKIREAGGHRRPGHAAQPEGQGAAAAAQPAPAKAAKQRTPREEAVEVLHPPRNGRSRRVTQPFAGRRAAVVL